MNKLGKLLLSLVLCVFCLETSCSNNYRMGPVDRFVTDVAVDACRHNQAKNLVREMKDTNNLLAKEEKGTGEREVVVRESREGFLSTLRDVSKTAFVLIGVAGVGIFSIVVIDKVANKINLLGMFNSASEFVANGIAGGLNFMGSFVRNGMVKLFRVRPAS